MELCRPSARGGLIAALRDGDIIVFDVARRQLNADVTAAIARRLRDWTPPAPRYPEGAYAKYAALVSSASEGAITRPTSGLPRTGRGHDAPGFLGARR